MSDSWPIAAQSTLADELDGRFLLALERAGAAAETLAAAEDLVERVRHANREQRLLDEVHRKLGPDAMDRLWSLPVARSWWDSHRWPNALFAAHLWAATAGTASPPQLHRFVMGLQREAWVSWCAWRAFLEEALAPLGHGSPPDPLPPPPTDAELAAWVEDDWFWREVDRIA